MSFSCPEDDAFELLAENKLCQKTLFNAFSNNKCVGSMIVIKTTIERKDYLPLYYANNFIFNDFAWKLYIFPDGLNDSTKGSVYVKVKNVYRSSPVFGYEFILDYGCTDFNDANLIRGELCGTEFFKKWNSSDSKMNICCALRFAENNFRGNVDEIERVYYGDEMFSIEPFGQMYVLMEDSKDVSLYQQDIILKGDGWKFLTHSSVLARNSIVFKLMFGNDEIELNKQVEIKDVQLKTMEDLLHFVYTGRVRCIDYKSILRLTQAADRYLINNLKSACEHYLCYNINLDSIAELMIESIKLKLPLLKALCSLVIRIDFDKFALTHHWKRIAQHPEAVLFLTRGFVGSFDSKILDELKEITTLRLYGFDS